jgi:hypothetical protein
VTVAEGVQIDRRREAIRASHADRVQLRKKTVKAAIPLGWKKAGKAVRRITQNREHAYRHSI